MNSDDEFWEPPENEETHVGYVEPVLVNEFEPESTEVTQQTDAGTSDVIYEDLSGASTETNEEVITYVTVQDLDTHFSNLIHVNLFGFFLVAGVLVGLMLLRNRYDN